MIDADEKFSVHQPCIGFYPYAKPAHTPPVQGRIGFAKSGITQGIPASYSGYSLFIVGKIAGVKKPKRIIKEDLVIFTKITAAYLGCLLRNGPIYQA